MVLLFIAMIVAILAALSLGLVSLATLENNTVIISGRSAQLVQIVYSGIEAVAQAIDDPQCPDLVNNPERFHSIEVVPAVLTSTALGSGRFTVFSPLCEQDQVRGVRFGLTRESAKLSLESILAWETELPGQGVMALEKLPGMTPEICDSILDWLDADDDPRPQGAEAPYYKQQQKTYTPRNAVPIALEELLLIRGVKRPLLFGEDYQLAFGATQSTLRIKSTTSFDTTNPFAELSPSDFDVSNSPGSNSQGISTSAWQFLLTPYSAEKLVAATLNEGQTVGRIFLNDSNLEFLESQLLLHQLDNESVQFIMSWRRVNGNIDDVLDLLGAEITVDAETISSPFSCSEPAKLERFLRLLDETTTESAIVLRGRINVNEAPRPVLEAVPELTPELVTEILERREGNPETRRHAVWLLAEEIVDVEMMRMLSRRLTTGGDVYRIQVAGFFEDKPMFYRAEAVLDATVKPPKMVSYKDLTPLTLSE